MTSHHIFIFCLAALPVITVTAQSAPAFQQQELTPGVVESTCPGHEIYARGMALQPDGKILVTGGIRKSKYGNAVPYLARFEANGLPDNSFGRNGLAIGNLNYPSAGLEIFVLPKGAIAVVGSVTSEGKRGILLQRYLRNGTPDTLWGANGIQIKAIGACRDIPTAALLQPDGKFIVSGLSCPHDTLKSYCSSGYDWFIARYLPDGRPDTGFGVNGVVMERAAATSPSVADDAYSLALQPDGKIVAAVDKRREYLLRLHPDGTIDSTFGEQGWVRSSVQFNPQRESRTLLSLSNGKLMHLGQFSHDVKQPGGTTYGYTKWQLERLLANGEMDAGFGEKGEIRSPLRALQEAIYVLRNQKDSIFYIGGYKLLEKVSANGVRDTVFAKNSALAAEELKEVYDLRIQANGSILALSNETLTLGRFLPTGRPDTIFGLPIRKLERERELARLREIQASGESEALESTQNSTSGFYGRRILKLPNPPEVPEEVTGVIVLKICIDPTGKVLEATVLPHASTIHDKAIWDKVIANAVQYKFSTASAQRECGNITFRFKNQ